MNAQKFQTNANTIFGRFVQTIEESINTAERTPYSSDLTSLIQESEKRRVWADSILAQLENVIQPNPALRVEDFILKGMDRKKVRLSANEQLGESMDHIGCLINETSRGEIPQPVIIGVGTVTYVHIHLSIYINLNNGINKNNILLICQSGEALRKCAAAQKKIGESERRLQDTVSSEYISWLRLFTTNEVKVAKQEREKLENARLDLDRLKTMQKRAKNDKQHEHDQLVKEAQSKFASQCAITKQVLQESIDKFDSQKDELRKLLTAQSDYFRACSEAVDSALRAI
ncbi:SH3-domain GRB2-like endophilin B1 [Schistosoma japonicum]|nr:SH3-domain GRB2-like endophilin B1 [Schistosoma japonicum]